MNLSFHCRFSQVISLYKYGAHKRRGVLWFGYCLSAPFIPQTELCLPYVKKSYRAFLQKFYMYMYNNVWFFHLTISVSLRRIMGAPRLMAMLITKGKPRPRSMSNTLDPSALDTAMSPKPSRATRMELSASWFGKTKHKIKIGWVTERAFAVCIWTQTLQFCRNIVLIWLWDTF